MHARHAKILEIMTQKKKATVTELAETLAVSEVTMRKDLSRLEAKGFLKREHGYALLIESDDVGNRLSINYDIKRRIAQEAVSAVSDGETVMIESGSTAITKLQTRECAAIMILEESILKVLKEADDAGTPITNLKCIYPEDGVVLIPSTVMTVAEDHSKNVNIEACEAVEKWLLTEEAQKLILEGYMHSVFKGMEENPYQSVDTEWLIEKDLGVDWENAFKNREAINTAWTETVTTK